MDPNAPAGQPTASSVSLLDLLRGTPKNEVSTNTSSYTAVSDGAIHAASLLNVLQQSISTGQSTVEDGTELPANEVANASTEARVNEASTAELKSVLFGGLGLDGINSTNDTEVHITTKSQSTDSRTTAVLDRSFQLISPEMAIEPATPTTAEQLERSLSIGSQSALSTSATTSTTPAIITTTMMQETSLTTAAETTKAAPTTMFTYVNPFDLLPKAKRSLSNTSATAQSTPDPNNACSEPSVQSGYGASPAMFSPAAANLSLTTDDDQQVQRHHSPMMVGPLHDSPEHTARWTREQNEKNFAKGVPNGVRLPSGDTCIDVTTDNLAMMATQDLEVTTITLMPTEPKFYVGNTIAATKTLIAYATKGGKFRVIHQLFGTRALIAGHEHTILDLAFFNALQGGTDPQRLVTVGIDHRLCVWQFSEPQPTKRDSEIPSRIILELDGAPANINEPRFRRAIWHPSNPDILACAADRGHLLVFNLRVMLAGKDDAHVIEGERNVGAIQLKGHTKPIIDLCFSADGSEIITASEDGTVRLWHVSDTEGSCVGVFTPCDGRPVTTAKFVENVVDGQISDALRCILVATDENRLVRLLNHDGSHCIQQLEFVSNDPSNHANFFNVINYDASTKTLALGNSYRESLYCAHVRLDDSPQFVYLIEFPLEYPIVSLAVAPDCTEEADTFALCCIQTGAVQQFHVPFHTVLPRRWERCQVAGELYEDTSSMIFDRSKVATQLTEAELLHSLLTQASSSGATDMAPATSAINDARSPELAPYNEAGGSDTSNRYHDANSRRTAIEPTRSISIDSHGKGKGPKSANGGSVKSVSSPSNSLPHAGLGKAAGKLMESNMMIRDHPAFRSPLLKPRSEASEAEAASVTMAQLRSFEDNVVSRVGKLLNKELTKREERWERERQVQLATEISHFEALLSDLAHTLHDTLAHMVVDTIQAEMSERILPALERSMANTMEQSVTTLINGTVAEQVQQALSANAIKEPIQQATSAAIRPVIEHTMQTCIRDIMLPVWQQSMDSIRSAPPIDSRRPSVHHTPHYTPPITSHNSNHSNNTTMEPHTVNRTQAMTNDLKQTLMTNRATPTNPPSHYTSPLTNDVYLGGVEAAIAANNFEEAIVKTLESKQPAMLELLMQRLNPAAVFPAHQPTTLSQPIVLALLHQIGLDIQHSSQHQQQILWIQSALNHLNVKDPIIKDHCRRLLPELEERVKIVYYTRIIDLGISHSATAVISAILSRLNSLITLLSQS
ncbi:hypothetical protein BDF19DRAFT_422671 [Syncephalis fuscata]|nr:hypothetical protein BDF19DRAFT_422671 [Syncephalis fuscata]